MLSNFNKRVNSELRERMEVIGMSMDETLILASIIEREAGTQSDMELISSVFHNRLNSNDYPYLESCATVQYILGERKPVLSIADTQIDSAYNTYQNKGLPPGPISSPGLAAIQATLFPPETDNYFFVAKSDGSSLFAKTYDEHKENIEIANKTWE
jgi:UPF0755 protein